jgi:light-regulated signal transduction histidine kinase (bacteriophytochrome)
MAQLQAANEELEAFTLSISHDLRAPLHNIFGFVGILEEEAGPSLSGENLRRLAAISRTAARMGKMIDDLLAFARVGSGGMQKTTVNLDELVRETVDDLQPQIKGRDIVWDIRPLPMVQGDPALLGLALGNLISNAVKFTGARAQARIDISSVNNSRDETAVSIRDNGAGFDPRRAGKLFGVFQRLHPQDEFEGTGVGLANVQRIIHRHGGRVWAEGVVNAGATFYFSLPDGGSRKTLQAGCNSF